MTWEGPDDFFAVAITMKILSTLVVFARIYVRGYILKKVKSDDYLMAAAWLTSVGMMAVHLHPHYGSKLGTPTKDLTPKGQESFAFCLWLVAILYGLSYSLCKLSVTTQYMLIFQEVSIAVKRTCQILLIVVLLSGLWATLGPAFACIPIDSFWRQDISGSCLSISRLYYSIAGLNLITDLAIFTTPLPSISKLNLQKQQKIALIFVFTLGFFVCIISVVRIVKMHSITQSEDKSKDALSIAFWSSVELNTALICCTLPMLKPLYVKFIPSLGGMRPKTAPFDAVTTVGSSGKNRPVLVNDELMTGNDRTQIGSQSMEYRLATMSTAVAPSIRDEELGVNAKIDSKETSSGREKNVPVRG